MEIKVFKCRRKSGDPF